MNTAIIGLSILGFLYFCVRAWIYWGMLRRAKRIKPAPKSFDTYGQCLKHVMDLSTPAAFHYNQKTNKYEIIE